MSCSNIITTYTNAKYLYRGPNRYRQQFTCGCCSSCISKQRTDWRVRSYYESLATLQRSANSFVLFDTLTYCDDYIKTYRDMFPDLDIPEQYNKSCFSRPDVQKFFKRLRVNLKRDGYKYDSNQLRYILTSEYGSDEKVNGFQRTHRPHYHVLFFVTFNIHPIEFSRHVARAWHLGKTDGVRPFESCSDCYLRKYCRGRCLYQSESYVLNERIVSSSSRGDIIKCVNYVTKYVSKDMYITSQLKSDVDNYWLNCKPDYQTDILLYRQYRRFLSQVMPFHLQSRGFGLSLLADDDERKYMIETNQVHLPTNDRNVVLSVALPRYYQRKLYYDYKKVDGRVVWFLTDYGVEVKMTHIEQRIKSFMQDYRAMDSSLSDSQLFDLSLYKHVYKGTFSDVVSLYKPWKTYYRTLITHHPDDEQPLYINRNTKVDKMTTGAFLSTRYLVDDDGEIHFKGKQLHKEFIPYHGYKVIDDKVCCLWYGFDKKLLNYDRWRKDIASARDVQQYNMDKRSDYYRCLGLLSSVSA